MHIGYAVHWFEQGLGGSVPRYGRLVKYNVVYIRTSFEGLLKHADAVVIDHVEIARLGQEVEAFLPAAVQDSISSQRERLEDVLFPHVP